VRHLAQSYSPDGKRIAYWSPATKGQQLWVANANLSAPVKLPVTNVGVGASAVWSPDGSRLAAVSSHFGLADVVVVPAAGGEARRVTTGPGVEVPLVWYPDGDRLAYLASAAGGTISSFVVSVRTGVSTSLVPGEKRPFIGMPSPDGSQLAYFVVDGPKSTIWVADSAGGNPRQLTTEGFEAFSQGSTWSPDGKEILYESRRTGTTDLWIVPIAGGVARQLTRDVRNDRDAAWSPDGRWVAFRSDRGRQTDVWVVPASGGEERRVTDSADEEQAPLEWRPGTNELTFGTVTQTAGIWAMDLASGAERKLTPDSIRTRSFNVSPDGNQVSYVVERGGGVQDLVAVPLAGGQARTLVSGGGTVQFQGAGPLWSPDGSKIVFPSDRGGTQDIWVVDAAGGAPRQLTNWPGFEYGPVWSGDGTAVYFTADRDTRLGDVWKVAVSGGEPVRVTNNGTMGSSSLVSRAGVADLFGGTINPSRGQLGFSRVRPDGRMNVVWDRTNAYPVAISLSGDSVAAMVEQPSGKIQMMILPAAGGTGRTILGADDAGFGFGSWSSDGKSMLYGTSVNGANDLGLLTLTDGTKRRLTTTTESEEGAEFTPDAKTVVFRRSATVQRLYAAELSRVLAAPR